MATCYICGDHNADYRREVPTGHSKSVWFGRRLSGGLRSYYGVRSVCASCAADIDKQRGGCTRTLLWVIGIALVLYFLPKSSKDSTKDSLPTTTEQKNTDNNLNTCRILSSVGVNLRSEPNSSSSVLATIPYDETVTILSKGEQSETIGGKTGNWYEVEYDGTKGWLFSAFVELNPK
jgi:hypothetical protein